MQLTVIGRDGGEIPAIGFDFFQYIALRVIAVCPAPYLHAGIFALQAQFGLIAGAAP